jgi:ABC-type oligopeptide transport system substrate-binding subunit
MILLLLGAYILIGEMIGVKGRTREKTLSRWAIIIAVLMVFAGTAFPARAQSPEYLITWFVGFNTTLPPFDDVMMRRAVAHALNRDLLTAADTNYLSRGIEPPGCLAHNPAARAYPFDPQKAKELIAQSKIDLNQFGDLGMWHISRLGRRDTSKKELEILTANLKEAGLGVRLREFGNYDALRRIATLPVVHLQYWGVGAWSSDCSGETFIEDLVHSKGDNNHFGYTNPEIDALIVRARAAGSRQDKIRLFQQVEQKILDDAILVPIWWWRVR